MARNREREACYTAEDTIYRKFTPSPAAQHYLSLAMTPLAGRQRSVAISYHHAGAYLAHVQRQAWFRGAFPSQADPINVIGGGSSNQDGIVPVSPIAVASLTPLTVRYGRNLRVTEQMKGRMKLAGSWHRSNGHGGVMTHAANTHVVTGDRHQRIDDLENHAATGDDSSELRMLREAREREEEFRAWQASHCGAARLGWDGQKR